MKKGEKTMENNESLQGKDFSDLSQLEEIQNDFSFLQKGENTEEIKVEDSIDETITDSHVSIDSEQQADNGVDAPPISDNIEASAILEIFDIVFSRLTSFGCGMMGYQTRYQDFKLDASEKKALEKPLAKVIEKHGFGNVSPEMQLLIVSAGIYAFKFSSAIEKAPKPSQREKEIIVPRGTGDLKAYMFNKDGSIKPKFKHLA